MQKSLQKSRLEKIKNSINNANSPNSLISYFAPWYDKKNIRPDSVDMIFSQAVLEHVEDQLFIEQFILGLSLKDIHQIRLILNLMVFQMNGTVIGHIQVCFGN